MSCGTCPDSAQPTTRQDGTAPTPASLLWSADVGDWYRRQRALGGRPVVPGTVVVAPAAPAHAERQASRFEVPHYSDEAAPLITTALHRILGHADFVATPRPLASSRENPVYLTHRSGQEQPWEVWQAVGHCLACNEALVRGRRYGLLLYPATDGHIPTITASTGAVLATAAARDLLRAIQDAPEGALYGLMSAGQAALYTVRLSGGDLATDTPALHETRLRLWPGGKAGCVWSFTIDAHGTLVRTTEEFADGATAQRFIQQEQADLRFAAAGVVQHCCACGYVLLPAGTCPRCQQSREHWSTLASKVGDAPPSGRS